MHLKIAAAVFAGLAMTVTSRAAFEEKPPSARAAGMSEAMTAVAGDGNSLYYNPAGLRFSRHKEVLSSYTQLFAISELPYHFFAFALPTEKHGAWGVSASQFGPDPYREQEVALTHSVFVTPAASFGYTLRRSSLNVKRYGSASAIGLDAGVAAQLASRLKAGFAVRNINHPNLGSSPEGPSQEFRAGVAFRPATGFLTALDAVKPVQGEMSYRAGQEIQLAPPLALRFGVETEPSRYSAGFGFRWKIFHIDYAFLTHPLLHDQQHVSMSFWWGPEEELQVAETDAKRSARRKAKKKASKSEGPSEKVDLNTATIEQLMTLPGIGRVTAQNILDYRKERGGFTQELELLDVPKFQRRIFIRVRPYVTVGAAPGAATPPAGAETPAEDEEALPDEPMEEEMPEPVEEPVDDDAYAPPPVPAPLPTAPALPPVAPAPPAPDLRPERSATPAEEGEDVPTDDDAAVLDRLNTAGVNELQIFGLTSIQAKNIVRYRQRKGTFRTMQDLRKVPGISARTVESLRSRLR